MSCKIIKRLTKVCGGNTGTFKKIWITDYIENLLDDMTVDSSDVITAISPSPGLTWYEFEVSKNSAHGTENSIVDQATDGVVYEQTITAMFKRHEAQKRLALSILLEGNRDLIVATLDGNNQVQIWGLDAGLNGRLESAKGETRQVGSMYTLTISNADAPAESFMGMYVDDIQLILNDVAA